MKTQGKNRFLLIFAVCFSVAGLFFLFAERRGHFPEESVFSFPFETEDLLSAEECGNTYDSDETLNGSRAPDNRLLWRSGCLVPDSFEFHIFSAERTVRVRTLHFQAHVFHRTNNPRDGPFSC